MKRIITALITLGLLLGFTGCADSTKNTRADFVVIENYRTAEASEESDPVLNSVQSYCEETKSEYSVFTITDNTPSKLRGALDLAKNAECRFVIVPDEFRDTVQSVCADYPSIQFVLFDTYYEDLRDDVYPNLHALDFNYYEAGYLAGRAVPLNRYDSAGILDRYYDRRSAMFAQGFVKGAEDSQQVVGNGLIADDFSCFERAHARPTVDERTHGHQVAPVHCDGRIVLTVLIVLPVIIL
jgi:DNA-binding LacI/PurR family transcriptional regulator